MASLLETFALDAAPAALAAFARVLLEWKITPGVRWIFTVGQKTRAFLVSVAIALCAAQIARAYPKSTEYVPLPVLIIAVAFLGQEIGMKALRKGKRVVRHYRDDESSN